MKFTVPGIALAALIVASPVAFAQNTGYSGTTSKPGASVAKDDQTSMTKDFKETHGQPQKAAPCQGHELQGNEVQGANDRLRQQHDKA